MILIKTKVKASFALLKVTRLNLLDQHKQLLLQIVTHFVWLRVNECQQDRWNETKKRVNS